LFWSIRHQSGIFDEEGVHVITTNQIFRQILPRKIDKKNNAHMLVTLLLASIMKKSYRININSNKRAILVAILIYPVAFHLMTFTPTDWHFIPQYAIAFTLFFGPMYPVTILSRGQIKIELTEDALRTKWIKRFFLSKEKDVELSWNRIIDYVHQDDRGLDSFQLTLTKSQQYKFYRYTYYPQKDDYDKFLTQFPKYLRRVNSANTKTINQGKTDFQTRSFKWVLIGMTILAIGLLINTIINPDSETRWATIGIIFSAILFYWMQATRTK
jgi:hypothetical protein